MISTQKLLQIYLDICKDSNLSYQWWSFVFKNQDLPIIHDYYPIDESLVPRIDWIKANKLVEREIIKLLGDRLDK